MDRKRTAKVRNRLMRETVARIDLVGAKLLAAVGAKFPEQRDEFYREWLTMRADLLRRAEEILGKSEPPALTAIDGGKVEEAALRAISGEVTAGIARLIAIPGGRSGK